MMIETTKIKEKDVADFQKEINDCKCPMFAFELELIDEAGEYDFGYVTFEDEKLKWLEFEIEVDFEYGLDFNLQDLMAEIMESGKYN